MPILDQYGLPLTATDAGVPLVTGGRTRQPRIVNRSTGLGTGLDKGVGAEFQAIALDREQAERLYQMSWTCGKLVDTVVDDMFAAGRRWTGADEGANKAMEKAENDLGLWLALPDAIKAGRIFGTGAMLLFTSTAGEDTPLAPEDIKEGMLANLVSVDRWSLSVQNWQTDMRMPGYGQPYQYIWNGRTFGFPASPSGMEGGSTRPPYAQNVILNKDRMFRFDGVRSPLTEGWTSGPWHREWGISVLTRAIDDVMRDVSMVAAAGHLVNEASVWVQKIPDFREALARGMEEKGEASVEQIAEATNSLRSIYRTVFIDVEGEATRVDVTWGGLAEVLHKQTERIAAIEGIPITRFLGTSATGMSATGEGDARDWRITVEATRARTVDPILTHRLDVMLARHAGITGDPPEWEWNTLGDMTDGEYSELTHKRTEATLLAYQAGLVDEDEARERLSQDEWWGELGPYTMPLSMEMEAEAAERDRQDKSALETAKLAAAAAGGGNAPPGNSGEGGT